MPRKPPTIVAPLPNDPRVMSLAKATGLSRREAFAAAAEAWAWMSVMAVDGIVSSTAPDSLDGLVDVAGFGSAMLQAGLVGTVDGGLVLPMELRRERDQRGGAAATTARTDDRGEDEQDRKRKHQNREASRRYRKRNRATGSKPRPSGDKVFRSLGYVAGHEVRVFDGPHGCYAMVLGATVGGESYRKLTTGDKAWSLNAVRLVDTLPGLLDKWRAVHQKENGRLAPVPLVPTYADFRDDVERLTVLSKLHAAEAEAARHADGADASSRHADSSATSAGPSAGESGDGERKSPDSVALDASAASASRHADAFSSMSSLSKSSSHEEEDQGDKGRKAAADHERGQVDATEPSGMAEWSQRKERKRTLCRSFAEALHEDFDTVWRLWNVNHHHLRLRLEAAGIDPNTGLRIDAGASSEQPEAIADIGTTTASCVDNRPVARLTVARERDEPDQRDHNKLSKVERVRQSCDTLRAAAALNAGTTIRKVKDVDAGVEVLPVALG